jgi:hypothetical protein
VNRGVAMAPITRIPPKKLTRRDVTLGDNMSGEWFLTAPENAVSRRRGDPLGLRNITDEASELVAPGLTNRTVDARWLSILSWALVQSHEACWKEGGRALQTADDRRRRYEWLRPLELLWVKRSISIGDEKYRAMQWPGHDSVAGWQDQSADFGMTSQQLRNHRQLGPYGAYRVVLRTTGFTKDADGWTPDKKAYYMYHFVNDALGSAKPTWKNKPGQSDPAAWWPKTGWPHWRQPGSRRPLTLTSKGTPIKLRPAEINVLKPTLFAPNSIRLRTAKAIGSITANSYVSLCRRLGNKLAKDGSHASLKSLGSLAALTETGLNLLRDLAEGITESDETLAKLAVHPEVKKSAKAFTDAASRWLQAATENKSFAHFSEATKLAKTSSGKSDIELVKRFVDHHDLNGTGVRWMVRNSNGDRVVRVGAELDSNAGTYGYRLHALAGLAV